jgi:hypothetical protein
MQMADKSLYSRLKRLFSTNVIVRNVGGKKLKVADTDNIQSFLSSAMRDRYARIHSSSGYGQGNQYGLNMAYQTQRIMLFRDYDMMENDPIISSALDIYAEESTVKNEYGDILTIQSDNAQIKDVLHNLFYDILNIEFTLYMWIRNLVKYGDFFLFLEISPEYGIHNVMPLSPYDTIRIEGEKPENPYYVRFETMGANGFKQSFENYEIAHFRLISDTNFVPYGKSMIEPARRPFRQLTLMEDAMMINRIMRAPEKRVIKVDIGNIPPAEVDSYVQKLMDRSKKVPFIDPATGDYNLRYNMQNLLEDFWLPVRGKDNGTSIENLGGLEYNAIEDIEYIKNKMLAALKIPKAFLGYDESISGKATLAAEDVRFARTIERIQRIVVSELTKLAIVHLYAQGFKDEELVNFSLSLTNPSTIYEQEKINLWTQKVQLVAQIQGTKLLSTDWVYKNVFEMPEDEANAERDRLVEDAKRLFRLNMIEAGNSDPAKFGFPQDEPPQENPEGGAPGMGGGGGGTDNPMAPGGGGEAGGDAPDPNAPQSVDDLPTAEELGLEEDTIEETRGRPKKGASYGQDSHVRGRDPLGFKQRYKDRQLSAQRAPSRKSPLSLEMKLTLDHLKSGKSGLISEDNANSDAGTYLDERNIIGKQEDNN